MKKKKRAAQGPILAAGGIVTRGKVRPLFAVVRPRRQKSWVLPKGKLNRDETPLDAARREAIEETGHAMQVHEFLGSITYETPARRKTVRFWRMEASPRPVASLMKDISAVRWLPLPRAIAKLTHEHEKEFLTKAGAAALKSLKRRRAAKKSTTKRSRPAPRRAAPAKRGRAATRKKTAAASRSGRPQKLIHAPRQSFQPLWRWLGR